ncbi:MAG TPA: DEAD/DEAH box helicase [Polyangiaceae bacterium]|jgi:ATP-dependent RNA helicase DeaD|nr:MAG: ATP-dependent RNA helicase DbpA [Deltaproteobacteria bacterium ADurb.Bin207]HNS95353.1 DEAD/DEAH box helicase [Polyangiaceae bacterium]HNZ23189.1 DEAD/DEAH box helicase [Polyangiaceae bacterium]HOD24455.1 DEAD/DEAH box helicase [Polyangiaceae bacterium]HOE49775.1 DEAD/DEAH box helicase [Polyangiaceae bacterium]
MTEASEHVQIEDTPQLPSFEQMPLNDDVKHALAEMGYTHPAPVQHAVYDPAVRGLDVVVQARTGTGKTAAFGIPLVDRMIKRSVRSPQALVLTPTRELALQVSREIERIGSKRDIRSATVYGGAPIQRQIDALQGGAQIVVGTPGRVLDHLRRGTLQTQHLRILILDESDEMLSMGFERELNAIVDHLPEPRQTLLFSATLPPEIVKMASSRLHDPRFIYLSGDQVGALEILHFVYFVQKDKSDALLRLLEVENPESALIFCNTRDDTERVAGMLQRAGYDADWLNGDLPQSDREKVMTRSKEGHLRLLVATDVAARGIDISHLTHVINFDFPDSAETYVHRTGRTGRMGRTGTALSLITPHDIGALYYLRLTYKIRPFEKQLPSEGELKTRAHADVISLLNEAFSSQPHPDDMALARRLLTHDRSEFIIAGLLRNHLGDRLKSEEEAAEARRAKRPAPVKVHAPDESSDEKIREASADASRKQHTPPLPPSSEQRPVEEPEQDEDSVDSPPTQEYPRAEDQPKDDDDLPTDPPAEPEVDLGHAVESDANDDSPERDDSAHDSHGFEDEEPTGKHRTVPEMDLPRYEISPMTQEDLDLIRDIQQKQQQEQPVGHAALADWFPPAEDNDDQPILPEKGAELPPSEDDFDEQDELEVFVNVGRRDGVRPGDFVAVLAEARGIQRADIGRIRIRDKHTFIAVRAEVIDDAVRAIQGRAFGDRVATAARARMRED